MRQETGLVFERLAALHAVAEVHPWLAREERVVDQRDDVRDAERVALELGIVKEIDGRERVGRLVEKANADEAIAFPLRGLARARVRKREVERVTLCAERRGLPAAVLLALVVPLAIEREARFVDDRPAYRPPKPRGAIARSTLAARRMKVGDVHAERDALFARRALRPEVARPEAPPPAREHLAELLGRDVEHHADLERRHFRRQIGARMRVFDDALKKAQARMASISLL